MDMSRTLYVAFRRDGRDHQANSVATHQVPPPAASRRKQTPLAARKVTLSGELASSQLESQARGPQQILHSPVEATRKWYAAAYLRTRPFHDQHCLRQRPRTCRQGAAAPAGSARPLGLSVSLHPFPSSPSLPPLLLPLLQAGLDTRGASDFVSMLRELGGEGELANSDPVLLCTEVIK